MPSSRREFLKKIRRVAGSAIGLGVAAGAANKLQRMQSDNSVYPARRKHQKTTSESFQPAGLSRLIRPPGAVAEKAFLAGCIRCYRCQDACEPGAIQFFTETHGSYAHTPYVDPAIKGCTLCMKCTRICPTGVLLPIEIENKDTVAMGTVELRKNLCLSHKAKHLRDEQAMLMELGRSATESTAMYERRGPCGECHMFCPLRGRPIRLEPGAFLAPVIFPDECVGCGMCEEICRTMVRGEPAIRVVANRRSI